MTKFTDTLIKNLKPEPAKYYKREANGFAVKVWPSGVKTWVFIYTFDGKRKEMKLGEYPAMKLADARTDYGKAYELHKNGGDPGEVGRQQHEERRLAPTVEELAKEYVEKYAMIEKKSWEEDKRALNVEIIPLWGMIKAKDIRKRDIVLLLEGVVKRGSPVMANRLRALIHKMFAFATERDIIEMNPCSGVKPLVSEKPKERALSESEIKTLWESLDKPDVLMSPETKRALRLILITGQRPGEVAGMDSTEIDGRWWTIPAERSKNGKAHRVYLSELALELIGNKTGPVLPSPIGDGPITPGALHCALRRNLKGQLYPDKRTATKRGRYKKNEIATPPEKNRIGIDSFSPHDLRRTMATRMAEMGTMEEIIDRVLNHVRPGIIRTYNVYAYDKEIQKALESWERKLTQIITGKCSDNVISITKGKVRAAA